MGDLWTAVDLGKRRTFLHFIGIDERCRGKGFRRSEGVTLGLFGQRACFPSERALYRYAQRHLRAAFPHLPARSDDE